LLPKYSFLHLQNQIERNISKDKLHIEKLKTYFKTKKSFKTNEIAEFSKIFEPNLSQTTTNWRIFSLVKKGILKRIGRGKFTLGITKHFLPEITSEQKSLQKKIKKDFPFLDLCIWNTSCLNEFSIHQTNQYFQILEVEKEITQSIFIHLKEQKKNVFLEPTKEVFERYVTDSKNVIIVKTLITEAPTLNIDNIKTSSLEKILVDIFCDEIIFSAYQGNEMKTIYKNSFSKYAINESKLLRYANRRGKKSALKNYLKLINGK